MNFQNLNFVADEALGGLRLCGAAAVRHGRRAPARSTRPRSCARSGRSRGGRCTSSRRAGPADGRYGENPFRVQMHHQLQVLLKPAPRDAQQIYLDSLRAIGIDIAAHDVRFIEDDWESPTLGATGLGWQVWARRARDHAVHLLPAGRRLHVRPGVRRVHLRFGAHRDGRPGQGEPLRPRMGQRPGPMATCASARSTSARSTTSRRPMWRRCGGCSRCTRRSACGWWNWGWSCRVRFRHEMLAHVQPARRAARDQRQRAHRRHHARPPHRPAKSPRRSSKQREEMGFPLLQQRPEATTNAQTAAQNK